MNLDHILYVGPDLDELGRELARVGGVAASVGGTHPGQGTHNALVDLGPGQYLELMAPDPDQLEHDVIPVAHDTPANAQDVPSPAGDDALEPATPAAAPPYTFYRSIAYAATPQLFTWCARVSDAETFTEGARSLGLNVTRFPGSRHTPSGHELRWDLMIVGGHGLGGVVPFFIDWHDSPHPAATVGAQRTGPGLRLEELELRHPDDQGVTSLLAALRDAAGVEDTSGDAPRVMVTAADSPLIVARLVGAHGPFELHGTGGSLAV